MFTKGHTPWNKGLKKENSPNLKGGRKRVWSGYEKSIPGQRYNTFCVTCGKPISKLISVIHSSHHKEIHTFYCSRGCYKKSFKLKQRGKTLYFKHGRVALIHLDNLRVEAYNLGMKVGKKEEIKCWWQTTKKQLEEYIYKVKQIITSVFKKTIIPEIGPVEINYDIPPLIPPQPAERKTCLMCGSKMTLYRQQWWCECTAHGPA